jgi:hypothetical protein
MKKLIGILITAAVTFGPASAAFAERGNPEGSRRSTRPASCAVDAGVLTRSVDAQALCGGGNSSESREGARRSSRQSSCTVDAGVLTRTVNAQVFCGGQSSSNNNSSSKGKEKARRTNNRRSSSCTLDAGVLTRTIRAQALCSSR